ncbi:Response regulator [Azospirillaceae bacterium]
MKRILIADDNETVRLMLRSALEVSGYLVTEATDGDHALSLMAETRFDLVITDLWMPKRTGIDLLKRWRQQHSHLRVIAISGGAPDMPIDTSIALAQTWGADAVLYKPFTKEDLDAVLLRVLGED